MLRRLVYTALLVLGIVLIPVPGFADDGGSAHNAELTLSSWPVILAGICGIISAHVTEVLSHRRAPQWVKSGINLVLVTLAGILITTHYIPGHTWKDYAAEIGTALTASLLAHWTGMTEWLQNASAAVGVGGSAQPLTRPAASGEGAGNF